MVSSSKMSVAVRLLEPEGYIVHAPPTQTITIYSTDTPGAIPRAKAYLQARLNAIVQANPWLTGRVVTDFVGTNLSLQYDPTANTLPLEESSMPKLSTAMLDYDYALALCALHDNFPWHQRWIHILSPLWNAQRDDSNSNIGSKSIL
ncbi:hypothetical protein AC1031_021019 [Aphanomyces cochlioides]|nr:hypothetical protein AC1031_021019 [Aphanomyces cochlioides]